MSHVLCIKCGKELDPLPGDGQSAKFLKTTKFADRILIDSPFRRPANLRPVCETPLGVWLKQHGYTTYWLAKRALLSHTQAGRMVRGQLFPTLIQAIRIEKATQGGVPCVSWLGTEIGRLAWNITGFDWDRETFLAMKRNARYKARLTAKRKAEKEAQQRAQEAALEAAANKVPGE